MSGLSADDLLDEGFEAILVAAYGDGRRESYDRLDQIVRRLFPAEEAVTLGADFGAFGGPMRPICHLLADALEEEGEPTVERAITAVLMDQPGNRALRDWTARRRPDLLNAVSEDAFIAAEAGALRAREAAASTSAAVTQVRVDGVANALDQLRHAGGGVDFASAFGVRAREDLARVAASLSRLAAFKRIHNDLHDLQTGAYAALAPLLAPAAVLDPAAEIVVDTSVVALESGRLSIEISLEDVPEEDRSWTGFFQSAIDRLKLRPLGREALSAGVLGVRSVLRQRLPWFDAAIIRTARDIPFERVIAFLRDAATRHSPPAGLVEALERAATDLADITAALERTLRLHETWQQVDADLWQLEQDLQPGHGSAEAVKFLWDGLLAPRLDALQVSAPDHWDVGLQAERVRATEALRQDVGYADSVRAFVRAARLQFSKVDKSVLEQSSRIAGLRRPLDKLLGGP